jgi:Sap-like sulfolipid-1-addressing protein
VWGSVLTLALLGALNPIRLSVALLVISRPRPIANLLAYLAGLLTVGLPALLGPLIVLHFTPGLNSFEHDMTSPTTAASGVVRHVQIGLAVLTLAIAALVVVRAGTNRTGRRLVPTGRPVAPTPDTPDPPTSVARLLGRVRNAWDDGSLWVAYTLGLVSGPSADGVFYVLAIIVPSGAAIGMQLSAAVVFLLGSFAVVELMLVGYLTTPDRTAGVVRVLHDWARAQRGKILVVTFAVLGISFLAQGLGG